MLFAFSVSPLTSDAPDGSVTDAVARAVAIVRECGLPYETTAMFTTIEGEWDEVMPVIRAACDAVAEVSPRVSLVLKADLRPGRSGEISGKVERLNAAIERLDSAGTDSVSASGPGLGSGRSAGTSGARGASIDEAGADA